jgi:hypothetical protein
MVTGPSLSPPTKRVTVWDIANREAVGTLAMPYETSSVTYSPDGNHILTVSADGIRIWPAFGTRQELVYHAMQVRPRHLTDDQVNAFFLARAGPP